MYLSLVFILKIMLTSPFSQLSKKAEKKITFFLIFSTIIVGFFMIVLDSFLTNETCKHGIISFELTNNLASSKAIINSWNTQSKISAGISLGLDFLFLILYSSLIAILIHKLNKKLWINRSFYSIGVVIIFGQFLAGIFDAIENIGLIQLLLGNLSQFWVSLAYYFAFTKFIIIGISFLYIIINFILLLIKKSTKNE